MLTRRAWRLARFGARALAVPPARFPYIDDDDNHYHHHTDTDTDPNANADPSYAIHGSLFLGNLRAAVAT